MELHDALVNMILELTGGDEYDELALQLMEDRDLIKLLAEIRKSK